MRETDPAHPVRVFVARSMTEARLAVAFLGDRGIPARVEDALSNDLFPGFGPIVGRSGGVGVAVSSEVTDQAEAALRAFAAPAKGRDEEE